MQALRLPQACAGVNASYAIWIYYWNSGSPLVDADLDFTRPREEGRKVEI